MARDRRLPQLNTGSMLWWLILSGVIGFFRRALTPERLRWVNRVSGGAWAALGVLAIASLWR